MKEDNSIEKFKVLGNFINELAEMSQQFKELKSSELSNRMMVKRYRDVFHNFPERIFVKDKNFTYLLCNELYARDLQIKTEEIAGKSDFHFFPEEYAKKFQAAESRALETGKTDEAEETVWLGGQELVVHFVRVVLKDEDGHPAGILGVLRDVTEKARASEETKKYRTHLEELVFERTSELEKVSNQLQGERASRKRIEEEYQRATEDWKGRQASLEGQGAERVAELQRMREQVQEEASKRQKIEESLQQKAEMHKSLADEYRGMTEEFKRIRTDLESQLAGRAAELQKINEQLQKETGMRLRIEEETRRISEEFKKTQSELEVQLSGRNAELQRINEHLQQEMRERKRFEEDWRGISEEYKKVRTDLESRLAESVNELRKVNEQWQQEMNARIQVEANYGKATEECQRLRAELGGQLSARAELQQVREQLQREIAERKKAVEAMRQSMAQFWTLMDSVEKIISELGRDTL